MRSIYPEDIIVYHFDNMMMWMFLNDIILANCVLIFICIYCIKEHY